VCHVPYSSNGPLMSGCPPLLWALAVITRVPRAPTVAMGEVRSLLLEHHSSDGTVAAGHLPVAIEGYGPLVHRHIVVVLDIKS
jgi:hypothetical protein